MIGGKGRSRPSARITASRVEFQAQLGRMSPRTTSSKRTLGLMTAWLDEFQAAHVQLQRELDCILKSRLRRIVGPFRAGRSDVCALRSTDLRLCAAVLMRFPLRGRSHAISTSGNIVNPVRLHPSAEGPPCRRPQAGKMTEARSIRALMDYHV